MNNIKDYFQSLPEVKRIKELEHYIDTNSDIQNTFNELKDKQKQMVNAKEYDQINQYKLYCEEYNEIRARLLDLPFVEEYLELLEIVNSMLSDMTYLIENKISKIING